MTKPESIAIILGTSNAIKIHSALKDADLSNNVRVFAIGDCDLSVIPFLAHLAFDWIAKRYWNHKPTVNLLIDTFVNDFYLARDSSNAYTISPLVLASVAASIQRLRQVAFVAQIYLLDLIPRKISSQGDGIVYPYSYSRFRVVSSWVDNCKHLIYSHTDSGKSLFSSLADPLHFEQSSYLRLSNHLQTQFVRSTSVCVIKEGETRASEKPYCSNFCFFSALASISYLHTVDYHKTSLLASSFVSLLPNNVLRINYSGLQKKPTALIIVCNRYSPFLIICLNKDLYYISLAIDSDKFLYRCINISDIYTVSDLTEENSEMILSCSSLQPANATSIFHSNSINHVYVDDSSIACEVRLVGFCLPDLNIQQCTVEMRHYTNSDLRTAESNSFMASYVIARKETPAKLYVTSFWQGFNINSTPVFVDMLDFWNASLCWCIKEADLILCSVFCNDYDLIGDYHRIKASNDFARIIFYTGENNNHALPGKNQINFSLYDYALSHYRVSNPRHAWLPNYLPVYGWSCYEDTNQIAYINNSQRKQKMAFFCYSNDSNPTRNLIAKSLLSYGLLFSCGKLMNNTNLLAPRDEEGFLRLASTFKVYLAIENSSEPGYTTEKLIMGLRSGSHVVYWGDPLASDIVSSPNFYNVTGMSVLEISQLVRYLMDVNPLVSSAFDSAFALSEYSRLSIKNLIKFQ